MSEALERYRQIRQAEMLVAVTRAMRNMEQAGTPINISRVAAAAGVSRQWLYNSTFRAEIEVLRARHLSSASTAQRPVREAASEASLRAQNQALRQRLKEMHDENKALRHHLERILGSLRR